MLSSIFRLQQIFRGDISQRYRAQLLGAVMLWEEKHPAGVFPHMTPHLPVVDPFPDDPQSGQS